MINNTKSQWYSHINIWKYVMYIFMIKRVVILRSLNKKVLKCSETNEIKPEKCVFKCR